MEHLPSWASFNPHATITIWPNPPACTGDALAVWAAIETCVAWRFQVYMSKNERKVNVHNWFVVSTHLKNICQNGNLPQIRVKIKTFETTTIHKDVTSLKFNTYLELQRSSFFKWDGNYGDFQPFPISKDLVKIIQVVLGFQVAIYPSSHTSWDLAFRVCVCVCGLEPVEGLLQGGPPYDR